MIASFGDKETKLLWETGASRKIAPSVRQRVLDRLQVLDVAQAPEDLRFPPSNRLEKLSGDLAGFWSIRVNLQWRIIFRFAGTEAHDVALVDYH